MCGLHILSYLEPGHDTIFSGNKREYHRWKKDWESLQDQGEPSGSAEVKKIQLLNSVDVKISRDLRLSTYNTAAEMFRVMENRYGDNNIYIIINVFFKAMRPPAPQTEESTRTRTGVKALYPQVVVSQGLFLFSKSGL